MGEPDSWEDMEPAAQAAPPPPKPASKFTFNPNAPSFSFNPSAPVFTPHTPSFSNSGLPTSAVQNVAVAPPVIQPPPAAAAVVSPPAPSPSPHETVAGAAVKLAELELDSSAADAGVASEIGNAPVRESVSDSKVVNSKTTVDAFGAEESLETAVDPSDDCSNSDRGEHGHEEAGEKQPPPPPEELDTRPHMNVVFIGHVDAGKSTIGGQILYLSDMVDERTIQKYEREAKEKNRESWYMAYIMDTNEEERAKGLHLRSEVVIASCVSGTEMYTALSQVLQGKTVEVGRAHFETAKSRFTILDAPGHKNYVPNMISGASQADVGVLVISARKGEFETGFERGGQTREHAQLAKTLGVSKLLVAVNKMDDPSVEWAKERFDEIEKKMLPFLKACGYNVRKDVQFLPISGLLGVNMKERMGKTPCNWWDGPSLFEALDSVELPQRDPNGPFRMPLIDKFKDMGTVVMGKIESGSVRRGDSLVVMPNKALVKVVTVYRDNDEVSYAKPGENLRIRVSGIEEEDISSGFVLSSVVRPIPVVLEFDAQLQILELLDHKAIFTAGYKAVLHIHSVVEECEIIELLQEIDPKTKKPKKKKVLFVKSGAVVVVKIQVNEAICMEKFEDFPQLGRFTLRDEGKTVAIGKVVKLPTVSITSE